MTKKEDKLFPPTSVQHTPLKLVQKRLLTRKTKDNLTKTKDNLVGGQKEKKKSKPKFNLLSSNAVYKTFLKNVSILSHKWLKMHALYNKNILKCLKSHILAEVH